jgi:hypothetical protein
MSSLNRALAGAALGAAVITGAVLLGATSANAYVVCNRFGECWHAKDRLAYPDAAGVVVHDDGWVFDRPGFYHWTHDHAGRGYWEHGHWRRF